MACGIHTASTHTTMETFISTSSTQYSKKKKTYEFAKKLQNYENQNNKINQLLEQTKTLPLKISLFPIKIKVNKIQIPLINNKINLFVHHYLQEHDFSPQNFRTHFFKHYKKPKFDVQNSSFSMNNGFQKVLTQLFKAKESC